MSRKRIEQAQKALFVRRGEKAHQSLRFIVENSDAVGRRMSCRSQDGERKQILRRNGVRVRFRDVTTSALITRVRVFGNELGESLVEPARDAVGVKAMQNEMHDLVSERIVAESVGRISLNEETARGMNSASPRLQFSERLKFSPLFRVLENVNVRFDIGGRLLASQFFRDDAIMKFGLNRNRCGDITVTEMVNEMLGLGVLPLLRMNRQRLFAERVRITLTQLRKFNFPERA